MRRARHHCGLLFEAADFSTVAIDNFTGSYLATEYLLSVGHRKIACVTGPLGPKTNEDRLEGYVKALNDRHVAYDRALVYEGDFHYQSGYEAVGALLPKKPTAVLCQNDMMAYGAIKGLKERKIRIPDDISVMGFDDIFFSEIMDIPLSTVQQPVYRMGEQAMRILQGEIECKTQEKQHVLFEPVLKIRSSTKTL
jgi:LacI family transcriptional regulator